MIESYRIKHVFNLRVSELENSEETQKSENSQTLITNIKLRTPIDVLQCIKDCQPFLSNI
jgi:hypothetical protein